MLQMVEASDAAKRTLIVLWDGKGQGKELGGKAHMVQIAKDAGSIDIKIIEAKILSDNQKNS